MGAFGVRQLGKTGLQVSPLGIGGGGRIDGESVLYAFERGINYFFYSSDLHHHSYQPMLPGLRRLVRRGSSRREKVILATVSYVNDHKKLLSVLMDQFSELGIDYIDIFHWGWITETDNMRPLVLAAQMLKKEHSFNEEFRQMLREEMEQTNQELTKSGLVRFIGSSFHSRAMAHKWMGHLDVLMLRYNIAHRGVEQEIVPHLYGERDKDPGIVTFNNAHEERNLFHVPPPGYPARQFVPTIPDCYRFALSQPWVDMVLTGVSTKEEIDQALAAVEQGPMSQEECQQMRQYGDMYRNSIGKMES